MPNVEAAERFAGRGYHLTPMAEIAADVGLTELFVLTSAEAADTSSPAHAVFADDIASPSMAVRDFRTMCASR